MDFRAILFDLDGTLLDTLADIAESANHVLAAEGYPTHPIDAYRDFIGDGLVRLFGRVLPGDGRGADTIARCVGHFRETYAENWNVRTRPYDGVADLLDALGARGLTMAILSNKPHAFARRCVDAYLAAWHFQAVLGQRDGVPPKPDPAGALEVAGRLEVPPERFVYLGDTPTDVQTARTAGMHPVGASWGFRTVAELRSAGAARIIDRPLELIDVLDGV
jgi:phosphoglycolate phosphatase